MAVLMKRKLIECMGELIARDVDVSQLEDQVISEKCHNCHHSNNNNLRPALLMKMKCFEDVCKKLDMFDFITKHDIRVVKCGCQGNLILSAQCPCNNDVTWSFTRFCLKSLLALSTLCQESEKVRTSAEKLNDSSQANFLGVTDERTVCSTMEFITGFGIYPNLITGVGIPLESESKVATSLAEKDNFNLPKLYGIIYTLTEIIKAKQMYFILFPKIFSSLIASLVQMRYCPEKLIGCINECLCQKRFGVTRCLRILCDKEKLWCEKQLDLLVKETYQPLLVQTFLQLQYNYSKRGNASNKWFVMVIGRSLSKCLLHETGVKNVLQGIVQGFQTENIPWQRYEMIAKIITRPSSFVSSKDEYFDRICPQVLELLNNENLLLTKRKKAPSHILQVVMAIIHELSSSQAKMAEKYIFLPLLKPFISLVVDELSTVLLKEEDLNCLHSLQMLLSDKTDKQNIRSFFLKYIHPMFILFILMHHRTDHVTNIYSLYRRLLKDCITSLLEDVDQKTFILLFHVFMFNKIICDEGQHVYVVRHDMTVQVIQNRNKHFHPLNVVEISTEERVAAILSILKHERFHVERGALFVNLLSQLSKTDYQENNNKVDSHREKASKELLEVDKIINRLKQNIELVSLISAMMDGFGPSILQDTTQIVEFIKNILENNHVVSETKDDVIYGSLDNLHENTLNMSLMLLLLLISTRKLTSSDYDLLTTLVPGLEKVECCFKDTDCCMMANQLKTQILSRGVIQTETSQSQYSNLKDPIDREKYEYDIALKHSTDPLIPTRGHGFIQLKQLLRSRNRFALKDHDKLFDIFEKNISHDDSFLYLAAIDGMIALAGTQHKKVLPLLCRKFVDFHETNFHDISCDVRMKICEAIIKICRECDEILPTYKKIVVSALLVGVKDHESSIRASSLAAIGEFCKILKFAVEGIIIEIFSCVHDILQTDDTIEVRRAAVQVFALLFKGLGTNLPQVVPHLLRDMYRVLKKVYNSEIDDVTRLHADNALNILDELMKDVLFADQVLEKHIQILS